ncbi:hypothetical protein ABT061_31940 [Streptosporangium sp. NPDC002544]|uniref:hypothetical protein n=1 Tax=Streptosporangium sp. NPDC002544 TaxID=3154538 RepID=UPI003332D4E4
MKVLANKCVICGDASSEKEIPGTRGHEAAFVPPLGRSGRLERSNFERGCRSAMVADGTRGPHCPLFTPCSSSSNQSGDDVTDDQGLQETRHGRIAINST